MFCLVIFRRRNSAPGCLFNDGDDDDFILVYEDFNAAMEEVNITFI